MRAVAYTQVLANTSLVRVVSYHIILSVLPHTLKIITWRFFDILIYTIIFVVSVCLFVCLFVCAEFFSAVFDPISIKLGHMLCVRV